MSEWVNTNPRDWALTFLLLLAWLLYNALRPVKDYYVLQRLYFDRLHQDPWRDDQFSAHYHGFDDFLAAKAVFDLYEAEYIQVLDTARTVSPRRRPPCRRERSFDLNGACKSAAKSRGSQ